MPNTCSIVFRINKFLGFYNMFSRNKNNKSEQERTAKTENVSYSPGTFIDESMTFLKSHMDADTYDLVMERQDEKAIPSVVARLYLNEDDWLKYIWIEKHGSLKGYEG